MCKPSLCTKTANLHPSTFTYRYLIYLICTCRPKYPQLSILGSPSHSVILDQSQPTMPHIRRYSTGKRTHMSNLYQRSLSRSTHGWNRWHRRHWWQRAHVRHGLVWNHVWHAKTKTSLLNLRRMVIWWWFVGIREASFLLCVHFGKFSSTR